MVKYLMRGGLMALAACGGGGGSDDPVAEYAEDAARTDRIIEETERLSRTSAAAMPVRGGPNTTALSGWPLAARPPRSSGPR